MVQPRWFALVIFALGWAQATRSERGGLGTLTRLFSATSLVVLPAVASAQPPVVTIAATDAAASEVGPDPGTFTVTRVGDTTFSLTVSFAISGSASNGYDYQSLTGSVTIPAGQSSTPRVITPINDPSVEGPETVTLTLSTNPNYVVGVPNAATVTIEDDDSGVTTTTTSTTSSTTSTALPCPGGSARLQLDCPAGAGAGGGLRCPSDH